MLATLAPAADITPTLTPDRTTVRLSESVRVTLTLEGPTPLRVEPPPEWLDETASANWRLRPTGPATLTASANGAQRWTQTFRADPYVPGAAVRLAFAPARASAGADPRPTPVTWPAVEVKVTTEVSGDPAETRPPTGIEHLPADPDADANRATRAVAAVTIALAAVALLTLHWLRRRGRRPIPPGESAAPMLDAAEHDWRAGELPSGAFAERVAHAMRGFVERRFGVPARRLTTGELFTVAAPIAVWGDAAAADLRAVLDTADRVKFAGAVPSPVECDDLLAAARRFVAADGSPDAAAARITPPTTPPPAVPPTSAPPGPDHEHPGR